MTIHVDEGPSLNTVLPLPPDREGGVGVLDVNRFEISKPRGQVIEGIEQPGSATASIGDIWCEKIRGCSCRGGDASYSIAMPP
jgi:hypothetical protein